jgi:hypothetical protein
MTIDELRALLKKILGSDIVDEISAICHDTPEGSQLEAAIKHFIQDLSAPLGFLSTLAEATLNSLVDDLVSFCADIIPAT